MRELRLVLLGLAAVIAILLGAGFLSRAFRSPSQQTAEQPGEPAAPAPSTQGPAQPAEPAARAAVERAIADAPDYTRFFDRLRLVFPSEYESILNGLASGVHGGDVNVDLLMSDAVAALRSARGGLAAKASDPALAAIFALQLKEMRELATRDSHLCVAFLFHANEPAFVEFAADHRALVADAAIAGLDAMASGRTEQVRRAAPAESDFQALDRALVDKGLSRPQIDALLDGKVAQPPIPDDEMCQAGQRYLETLAGLPKDVRSRLYGLAVDPMTKS